MQKSLPTIVAAGLLVISASGAVAGERPKIHNVHELKNGQCASASYVYEQGELLEMIKDTVKVCTTINGRPAWLKVDNQDLKRMSQQG